MYKYIHFTPNTKNLDPHLENCGKIWNSIEDEKLLKYIEQNKSINEVALLHKRTTGGIRSRLHHHAYLMHESGKTVDEIRKTLKHLSTLDIDDAIKHYEQLKNKKDTKISMNCIICNELLSIRETLQMLMLIELKKNNINYDTLNCELHELIDNNKNTTETNHNNIETYNEPNNIKSSEKTVNSTIKSLETNQTDNVSFRKIVNDVKIEKSPENDENIVFNDKLIKKIIKYSDNKKKLKYLRKKYGIPYKIFYDRLSKIIIK